VEELLMPMESRILEPSKRSPVSRRRTTLLVALGIALISLFPAASIQAAPASGADVVLVDLSVERAAVGTPYTYTYEIDNQGPDAATAVELRATLQGIASFGSASSEQGTCSYARGTSKVTCDIGGLAAGASTLIEIAATPAGETQSAANVSSAAGEDPDTSDNAATTTPLVLPADSADLWVYPNSGVDDTGVGSMGYALPGQPYDYAIDVVNYGPAVAKGVVLSVLLPHGVDFQSAEVQCTVFADPDSQTLVRCPLGQIEQSLTVSLTAVVPLGAAGKTLRTEVSVDGNEPDPGPSPNNGTNYLTIGPGLSAEDHADSEGLATIDVPVELFGSVDHAVTVDYETADGTALAGQDYEATSGTLTFAPGQTTQSVPIPLLTDQISENSETLTLSIANVDGGFSAATAAAVSGPPVTIVKPEAAVTILDNDPKLKINNVRMREPKKGSGTARFTIKLSHPSPDPVSLQFRTVSGSARAGADYTRVKKAIVFLPGQLKQTVKVLVKADRRNERTERFFGKLSKLEGALRGDVKGVATILDND
jgi:uncharacterized repeat protein (TIGR01451 family)